MMNYKRLWGIFFLALATIVLTPDLSWGQTGNTSYIQSPDEFLRSKGLDNYATAAKAQMEGKGGDVVLCGSDVCVKGETRCVVCHSVGLQVELPKSVGEAIVDILTAGPRLLVNLINSTITIFGGTPPALLEKVKLDKGLKYIYADTHQCIKENSPLPSKTSKDKDADFEYTLTVTCEYKDEGGADTDASASNLALLEKNTYDHCAQGNDSNTYCMALDNKNVVITYGNDGGGFKGCEVLPVKIYNQRKCFFCPLFKILYIAADEMATLSFSKLGNAFKALIGVGLALWIAVQTLTHVSSLTKQDAPKFLGNLIKQTFKFMIAFLLLSYSQQIYDLAVCPLLEAGLAFGQNLLIKTGEFDPVESVATTYYTPELHQALAEFISQVQFALGYLQAVGSSLICIGGHKMIAVSGDWDFGAGFLMAVQGCLFVVFGLLLSLAFAFYLIDAVVQLGIVGALMPFLIASWPFKITSGYAKKGWEIILNSAFVFVFLGMVISINLQLIDAAIAATPESGNGGLEAIYNAINNQEDDKLKELTDISGIGFLILVVCCIFGFKLCGKTEQLAGKMASGALSGIGSSIGTMGASAAVNTAKKVTAPAREAIGNKLTDMRRSVANSIGKGASSVGSGLSRLVGKGKSSQAQSSAPTTPPKAPAQATQSKAPAQANAAQNSQTTGATPQKTNESSKPQQQSSGTQAENPQQNQSGNSANAGAQNNTASQNQQNQNSQSSGNMNRSDTSASESSSTQSGTASQGNARRNADNTNRNEKTSSQGRERQSAQNTERVNETPAQRKGRLNIHANNAKNAAKRPGRIKRQQAQRQQGLQEAWKDRVKEMKKGSKKAVKNTVQKHQKKKGGKKQRTPKGNLRNKL